MIVLSCFDGISAGRVALDRAGIKVKKYYASEIDKYAIQVTIKNYPDTIQLGSITEWQKWNIEKPDMIIGGSPCQGFSFAGKQLNFEDERSKLFFVFVDILKHYKPKYFLLENVIMKKEYNDVISRILGELYPECTTQQELFQEARLEPIQINSALVSAQNRNRLYWTNIQGITQPKDKGILLKDIIENGEVDREKSLTLLNRYNNYTEDGYTIKKQHQGIGIIKQNGILKEQSDKAQCLDANYFKGIDNHGQRTAIFTGGAIRGRGEIKNTEQKLEIQNTMKSNALTSVSKDSLCIEIGKADLNGNDSIKRVYSVEGKSPTLTAIQGGNQEPKIGIRQSEKCENRRIANRKDLTEKGNCLQASVFKGEAANGCTIIQDNITWRKLTPIECERLQTFKDDYTAGVSNSQRYKALGNSWTVDVIAHIFSFIKLEI